MIIISMKKSMKFSFNDFKNQKTLETIYKPNNNQLQFQIEQSIDNKLIDKKNLNAYQAKSDSKIREKISLNQKFDKFYLYIIYTQFKSLNFENYKLKKL